MLNRTSTQMTNQQAIRYLNSHNSSIVELQRNVSSGIRLHRASDDPVAFRQVSDLSVQLNKIRSENVSINDTVAVLNSGVTALQQVNDLIVAAKSLAQQGVQTTTESERNALAVEVEGMLDSLKNLSATRSSGSYLFAGIRSDTLPYEFGGPKVEGGTLSVEYHGADENSTAFIGARLSVETRYSGEQIFSIDDRRSTLLFGQTGLARASGTDSVRGRASLEIAHTSTIYDGTSGVQPGASSAGQDSILGPLGAHRLTIVDTSGTGDFGTVVLNNGVETSWTRGELNLQVVDEQQRQVFVDMSGIAAGFSGTVDITSNGSMSIDGGDSTYPIDFSADQTIFDTVNGGQVHLDTTSVVRTGTEHLEFPGTNNLFQVFHDLANDLRNNRNFDSIEYSQSIDRRIGELNAFSDQVLENVGRKSASLQSLTELGRRLADLELDTETEISTTQSTDIPRAVLELQQHQSLLEFTYSITARISSTSILDFLR